MRKQQLREHVADLALEVFQQKGEIASLRAKLDEKKSAMHLCPICGLRHERTS